MENNKLERNYTYCAINRKMLKIYVLITIDQRI